MGALTRPDVLAEARALLLRLYPAHQILLTNSGTSALILAIRLATARRPDCPRIALPAWGCYDLATAVDGADIRAILYDLDPATLGPDSASLDRALARGAAAVVVVHFFGVPVNVGELRNRAAQAGALLIEDAAQAIGTELSGRPAGGLGDLGILSFGRGKGWTGGGGGALLIDQAVAPALALPAPGSLRTSRAGAGTVLKLAAQWLLARPACYALPSALPFLQLGQTLYRRPGLVAQMSRVEAALLRSAAALQAPETARRRAHAERLRHALEAGGAGTTPRGWAGGSAGWLRLPFRPQDHLLARCRTTQARRLGILPSYPTPLARLAGFGGRLDRPEGEFPGAEDLAARLHTLPTHGLLRETDLTRLERWLDVEGGAG